MIAHLLWNSVTNNSFPSHNPVTARSQTLRKFTESLHMENTSPFLLNGALRFTPLGPFNRLIERGVEQSTRLARLHDLYQTMPKTDSPCAFLEETLKLLNVDYDQIGHGTGQVQEQAPEFKAHAADQIPKTGGAVIVANHPFGGLEGIIMAHLLLQVRSDIKIVANPFLSRIQELKSLFIDIDPFETREAIKRNHQSVKAAYKWVENGGLLVIFPAGEVSHLHLRDRAVTDPEWKGLVARVVRRHQVPVVPIRFVGKNSAMFQLAGMLHPRLRTLMLPHEMLNKHSQTVRVHIGQALPYSSMRHLDDAGMIRYLRTQTYLLGSHPQKTEQAMTVLGQHPVQQMPVQAAQKTEDLLTEIAQLGNDAKLASTGSLVAYIAKADRIPKILQEIGRLRELTFRAVGEGTGRAQDLDLFDNYYEHLFIWDEAEECLVGSYRLGRTDEILNAYGRKGLYSHTLFKYKKKLLKKITHSIELGRSFVRQEYQKSFTPLMLLWKGIGEYVVREPRYHLLFGPVSISNDYAPLSQKLLVDFLQAQRFDHQLASYVKPRKKFKYKGEKQWRKSGFTELTDLDTLSRLISSVEADQKGVPILLKQYLKMGGHLLGFNVDDAFSQVLDGLIVVDLRAAEEKVLAKYMGKSGATAFLDYHRDDKDLTIPLSQSA